VADGGQHGGWSAITQLVEIDKGRGHAAKGLGAWVKIMALTRVSKGGESTEQLSVVEVVATLLGLVNNVGQCSVGWQEIIVAGIAVDAKSWRKRICGSRNDVVVIHVRSNRTEVVSGADYLEK
jgi:hypothetical protein